MDVKNFCFVIYHLCALHSSWSLSSFPAGVLFNTCIPGYTLTSKLGISAEECVEECERRTTCQAINYNRFTKYCELKTKNSYNALGTGSCLKQVLVNVRINGNLVTSSDNPCAHSTCTSSQRCNLPAEPGCIITECPNDVPPPQNGRIYGNMNGIFDQRRIYCNAGYEVIGNAQIQCKSDGTWETPGTCAKVCGKAPVVTNGKPVFAELRLPGSTVTSDVEADIYAQSKLLAYSYVTYICQPTYTMTGFNVSQCIGGNWSPPPACLTATIGISCTDSSQCQIPDSECRDGQCRCNPQKSFDYGSQTCVNHCVTFANTFQMQRLKKLNFMDDETLYNYNLTACQARCLEVTSFVCQSFDLSSSLCLLSANNANDGLFRDASDFNYYQRDCLTS